MAAALEAALSRPEEERRAAHVADSALEAKLTALMHGLRDHKASTGEGDTWEGKPAQQPLPFDFRTTAVVSGDEERHQAMEAKMAQLLALLDAGVPATVAPAAATAATPDFEIIRVPSKSDATLDQLMTQYLANIRPKDDAVSTEDAPPTRMPPATGGPRSKEEYDAMSFAELAADLEDVLGGLAT